jgi:DNA primase
MTNDYNISIREYLEALGIVANGSVIRKLIVCKNPEHVHRKNTPSLSINYDERTGKFKFYCFGIENNGEPCSLRGHDFIKFYSILEGINYLEAKSHLVGTGGFIRHDRGDFLIKKEKKEPGVKLPNIISPIIKDNYPKYLLNRGFSYENIKVFNPCFSPELNKYIILPIYDEESKQISWVGRIIDDNLAKKYPNEFPRYYNPYESFNKELLYGLWLPKISEQLFVVEGPFDVIGTYLNGFSVLGVFGIKFKSVQIQNILRFYRKKNFKEIITFFDYNTKNESYEMTTRLGKEGYPVSYIEIRKEDEDIDPGNIDKNYLNELIEKRKTLSRKRELF